MSSPFWCVHSIYILSTNYIADKIYFDFSGFIHPKVPSGNLFAQIDTFDDQQVIALTCSGGSAYVLKNAVDGQWDTSLTTTTGIKQISVGQDKIYGLLSNDSLGKYDKDTKTFVSVGAPRPMKYIGAGSIGTFYYVEMNRKLSCLNISRNEYDYNQHTSGSSHYIAVECGEKHCWLLTNVDYTPHRYIIIFPRGESCLSGGGFNDGKTWIPDQHNLLFDSLDTNKAGKTWMIQRSIEDVFYRYGVSSSNMLGEKWINVPGLKLVDVAVGKDTVYGITKENKFVYFGKYNLRKEIQPVYYFKLLRHFLNY